MTQAARPATHPTAPTHGNKIVLIGAGAVGIAYAYALLNQGLTDHLAIIDLDEEMAWAQVEDLSHSVPFSGQNIQVTVGTYADCRDAAIVVNCAGVAQREGETRLDLVARNIAIFDAINRQVMDNGFNGIYLVATNPVDVLSYATWKQTGLPAAQVIGSGTVLDTARWRHNLGRYFDIAPSAVHAYVIGEHGDSELPVLSSGSIAGVPIPRIVEKEAEKDPHVHERIDEMFRATRDAAYDIIRRKGNTSYGIGSALARITRAILRNEDVALPVSALLQGEYARDDVFIGTPTILNRGGVRNVVELRLDPGEFARFDASAATLRRVIEDSGLEA
ncbi:L-lactate dehydrogenase [Corynebacterium liangguodongii]|uniref:L-lactate dehydrogenase n=1 Tax=Corynebacterium liangguodongii TaxID=2079535 RepID=A0A2S0WDF8_9CORY|nr:L-lactate dehydrogenase [Corynebacterium liangguodongii]AWB83807.1 L-lactate dehydrogenase [Corynebacterium liangguodongii]PWB98928.1 L-lactate dehydrogenase [Corynebacterium liangguodongii]